MNAFRMMREGNIFTGVCLSAGGDKEGEGEVPLDRTGTTPSPICSPMQRAVCLFLITQEEYSVQKMI